MFMFPAPQAMVRYVARRGGLAGATPAEEARKARRSEGALITLEDSHAHAFFRWHVHQEHSSSV